MVDPRADLGLPRGAARPDSITIRVSGALEPEDHVLIGMMRRNRWRRPIYLACTVTRERLLWVWPYARFEALAMRVVPSQDPSVWDVASFRRNLFEAIHYRDIADSTIAMDSDTQAMAGNYVAALSTLASIQLALGDANACLFTLRFLDRRVPLSRLGQTDEMLTPLRSAARARLAAQTPR
jgi:hypothetical protein